MDWTKLTPQTNDLVGNAVVFKNVIFGGPSSNNFAVLTENGDLFNMHQDRNHRRAVSILRQDIRNDGEAQVTIDPAFYVLANGTRVGRLAHFTMRRITEKTKQPIPLTLVSLDDTGDPKSNPNTDKLISEIKSAAGNVEALSIIAEFNVRAFPNDFELDESGAGVVPISAAGEYFIAAVETAFADPDDVEDLEAIGDEELSYEELDA